MRQSVREGAPGVRLPPILLDGPPGIGKSAWARELGKLLEAPTLNYEATCENASFGLLGSQRGWGNAAAGRLLKWVLQTRVGNPLIVVDEIEKAGAAVSTGGTSWDLAAGLLPLLERSTARMWNCPYHEVAFDMSWVNWLLTSNNASRLPAPLLSRVPPIRFGAIGLPDLVRFGVRQGTARGLSTISIETICETLTLAARRGQPMSLRTVNRLLDHAAKLESGPMKH